MSESYVEEVAVEREWCLLKLLAQAEGRVIDPIADSYLIEQINASHIGEVADGDVTQCQVDGCSLRSVTTREHGILRIVLQDGQAACEQ